MNIDLGAISARAGAPNDGLKKDPFTFATSSEQWGGDYWSYGKYPVKIYNDHSVLIYQVDSGGDNSGKKPSGGVLSQSLASSMSATVANPITFYYGGSGAVVSQVGQSGDLYNYYLTSYSRGTDGEGHWNATPVNKPNVHNLYLDSYIPLRYKSIYDPCPYGYRIPSNGTYNQFTSNPGWSVWNYSWGRLLNSGSQTWIAGQGSRSSAFTFVGAAISLLSSSAASQYNSYNYGNTFNELFMNTWSSRAYGYSVRCIEE